MVNPKSYFYLGVACVAFIAVTGCIFELSSGDAQLGLIPTIIILSLSVPLGLGTFIAAVKAGRSESGE
nr:hypothetical protein [Synechococcus sp. PCC 6312]